MRILGIDVGLKRTGLAMSDETLSAIRFLPNLMAKNRLEVVEKLLSLINEFAIEVIVIGAPLPKTSGSIAIHRRAHGLKNALLHAVSLQGYNVAIYVWDEEDTSKRALELLTETNVPQKKRKTLLDAASAAVLVEEFIASNKKAMDKP